MPFLPPNQQRQSTVQHMHHLFVYMLLQVTENFVLSSVYIITDHFSDPVCACLCACMHACVRVCIHVHVCMCMCVHACVEINFETK